MDHNKKHVLNKLRPHVVFWARHLLSFSILVYRLLECQEVDEEQLCSYECELNIYILKVIESMVKAVLRETTIILAGRKPTSCAKTSNPWCPTLVHSAQIFWICCLMQQSIYLTTYSIHLLRIHVSTLKLC